jgi:hypothetical protein
MTRFDPMFVMKKPFQHINKLFDYSLGKEQIVQMARDLPTILPVLQNRD